MTAGLDATLWNGKGKAATPAKGSSKRAPKAGTVNLETMYQRPPDIWGPEYSDGYNDGYDGETFQVRSADYMRGYYDGQSDHAEHLKEMDRSASSNA